jgi:hypothetical protein
LNAQENEYNYFQPRRSFIGGNLGIQFGTLTILDVSPFLGYKLTNNLSIGAGFTYQFYKDSRAEPTYSSNIYGGRIFSSYIFIPEVFAYAEYEVLNIKIPIGYEEYARKNVSSVLVGAGYRQMIGPNLYSDIMILWNLTESPDSPYSNPIYRIGLVIGL